MKKFFKILLYYFVIFGFILVIFFIVFAIYSIYNGQFSDKAVKERKYLEKSKYISLNMKDYEIICIMGSPDSIIVKGKNTKYEYILNDNSFPYGHVYFDSDMSAKVILFPNNCQYTENFDY